MARSADGSSAKNSSRKISLWNDVIVTKARRTVVLDTPKSAAVRLNVVPVRSTNSHSTTASLAAIGGPHLRRFGAGAAPSAAAAAAPSAGFSRAFESSQTILSS
eukprot:3553193-Prymnesium_polylepis.1